MRIPRSMSAPACRCQLARLTEARRKARGVPVPLRQRPRGLTLAVAGGRRPAGDRFVSARLQTRRPPETSEKANGRGLRRREEPPRSGRWRWQLCMSCHGPPPRGHRSSVPAMGGPHSRGSRRQG
eukprot:15448994-Alexandrium_andersonii.AAC.1